MKKDADPRREEAGLKKKSRSTFRGAEHKLAQAQRKSFMGVESFFLSLNTGANCKQRVEQI